MIGEISFILLLFQDCFSRVAAFNWFVVIIMGFIVRLDHGVTSMIRWLSLDSSLYTAMLSFFQASSWQLSRIQQRWQQILVFSSQLSWNKLGISRSDCFLVALNSFQVFRLKGLIIFFRDFLQALFKTIDL